MTTATTLRIDESTYREAKAEAARRGMTVTRFIEDALRQTLTTARTAPAVSDAEIKERDRLMEGLLRATAHFRVGPKPTRDEMNAR